MLEVTFVILSSRLVILENKKLDWIIKVSSIDLIVPKLENSNKKLHHCFGLFRIKLRLRNTAYKILKLCITRESEFDFDLDKSILFSQRLLIKHQRFLCPSCKTSNGKSKTSSDSC